MPILLQSSIIQQRTRDQRFPHKPLLNVGMQLRRIRVWKKSLPGLKWCQTNGCPVVRRVFSKTPKDGSTEHLARYTELKEYRQLKGCISCRSNLLR
ncbi:hypothetical protein H4Q26_013774 [Puccinia striiformis f. sp. tritici PST-130]|nr:hypothetical protein H4Q26_013774 [Puccinia striiformis f. sp. tritici PST-130]